MGPVLVVEHAGLLHGLFVGAGLLLGAVVFFREVRRRAAYDERLLVMIAGLLVGGVFGMRTAGVMRALQADAAVVEAFLLGAKSILGGLAGAYVGVLVVKRLVSYDRPTGDLFAPAVALGMAIGRWGCFLTEPLGRETSLPWAIRGFHPSFLYEIAFHAIAFAALLRLRERADLAGALLILYLGAYAAFRFGIEFTRANELLGLGLTGSQWFILAVSPLLVVQLSRLRARTSPVEVAA